MARLYSSSLSDPRAERLEMVRVQIERRGIRDAAVLAALRTVPRHEFVPVEERAHAYADRPLPLGSGQTISQPYIVALMTELCELLGGESVLEVGTGSGYQAAVLAEIAGRVHTVELLDPLARSAAATLLRLRYNNVVCRLGDGREGWPAAAPFDAIVVTAAPERRVPDALLAQLKEGGRLVAPVGEVDQTLRVYRKREGKVERRDVAAVRFVPLAGEPG